MNNHIREYQGESKTVYTVVYTPPSSEHDEINYWKVYIRTPTKGFELVEAKSAAIDCGAPDDRLLTTHHLWRMVWDTESTAPVTAKADAD